MPKLPAHVPHTVLLAACYISIFPINIVVKVFR
jgi:hypothetical protein